MVTPLPHYMNRVSHFLPASMTAVVELSHAHVLKHGGSGWHPDRASVCLNLTGRTVVVCDADGATIAEMPSDGELRLVVQERQFYPYYSVANSSSNEPVYAIPIYSPIILDKLDEETPGYTLYMGLTDRDSVVVNPEVAQHIRSHGLDGAELYVVPVDPAMSVVDANGNTVGVLGLEWHMNKESQLIHSYLI